MPNIQNYTLIDKIFESTDTLLYRGHRNFDQAPVTVKFLKTEYPSPRELARLLHEFSILKELDVPGVAKAYALERTGNSLALVTESLSGWAVSELMLSRRFDLRTVLRMASSLAGILEAIHRQHIIHKDIKPHNFLYDQNTKRVYLIDFGIASRLSHEVQKLQNPGTLEGSLAYMSPEQTGRMNRPIDHRTDFYSFGVTLYELLTGELPFRSAEPMALVHSHIARKPVPPHQRAAGIPLMVSHLVMKLLAKAAEERYQTASGLKADLDECIHQLERTGEISEFPLGRSDQNGELLIPQKLYGRSEELLTLLSAFARCSAGATELLLVSGYSGVGKSALIHEVHKDIARRDAYFVSGKFEQFNRSVPYASITQAFRELIRQLLSESAESIAQWKTKLLAAIGGNGRLLTDLIPELEILIGAQPPLPTLGPSAAQNLFTLTFQNFVRPLATAEHPLVLFLDDLQWADLASLRLIQALLTDPQRGHMLLIGAFRDNEVSAGHPLQAALDELGKTAATINAIKLAPLSLAHVLELLGDALRPPPADIAPLAELIYEKTHGNPFFMNQFLTALHAEGLLSYSASVNSWTWNSKAIKERMATANVISFMADRISRLSAQTQYLLKLAACIGHVFQLQTLAALAERSVSETAVELWEALQESLLLPVGSDYRFAHAPGSETLDPSGQALFRVSYRFVHDRVHQAAYTLLDDHSKRAVHLRTGRLLLDSTREQPALREELLFEIVNHLNDGAALISDAAERWQLAQMNTQAGKKARAASAYVAAADYYKMGVTLLGEFDWSRDRGIFFSLYSGLAECCMLVGRLAEAAPLIDTLFAKAEALPERVTAYKLRVDLITMQANFDEAVRVGREALALLGVTFPDTPAELGGLFMAELQLAQQKLGLRDIDELVDAPVLDSPQQTMILQLLAVLSSPAYLANPTLFSVTLLKRVNIALEYGNTEDSAFTYNTYGVILATAFNRVEEGYKFAKMSLALNEKFGNAALTCKLNLGTAAILGLYGPIRDTLPYLDRGYRAGLESGDFEFLSYSRYLSVIMRLCAGDDLNEIREDIEKYLVVMQTTKDVISTATLTLCRQLVAALQGRTRGMASIDDDTFRESAFVEELQRTSVLMPLNWHYVAMAQLHCLAGSYEAAIATAQQGIAAGTLRLGFYYTQELSFYLCLAILGLRTAAGAEQQAEPPPYADLLKEHLGYVAASAQRCPVNNAHKQLLMEAELARCAGKSTEAAELYDRAIATAQAGGFLHHEAMANERCAQFYLSRNRAKFASVYLGDAHYCYVRWGATAKAAALVASHAELLQPEVTSKRGTRSTPRGSATTSSQMVTGALLDVSTILLAAQAISSEIVLDKVLDQLMKIMVTNAGAQRGFLILRREDDLLVDATVTIDPDQTRVGLGIPLESCTELPMSIIQYVRRTGEPIVLGNASEDSRYASDPYISAFRPKSVLCLALIHQGRLTGIVYLENNAAHSVFTADRIEVLQLLSGQAAIAVENALLYSNVQSVTERLQQSNQALSVANASMQTLTDNLRHSNQELSAANQQLRALSEAQQRSNLELSAAHERLQTELAQRAQAEQARAALQAEIIQMQNTRLAEMSTPLIPITEAIMVMPLIGTMDGQRAQQVLETALEGVQANRTHVVIIDITGMKHVDTSVASTLIQTAGALRLLGAQSVLTGIRAEVAQTLVGLGIDLGSIVTRGTLQSGIAYALSRTGESHLLKEERARQQRR